MISSQTYYFGVEITIGQMYRNSLAMNQLFKLSRQAGEIKRAF
jgi:hypothetical protein